MKTWTWNKARINHNTEMIEAGWLDFRGASLVGARLEGANLRGTRLVGANLRGTRLVGANLRGASLEGARLECADLRSANLRGTRLVGANLRGTRLVGANLRGASLEDANLRGANLVGANLEGADLANTCLDPAAAPNGNADAFQRADDGRCIGYRTRTSPYVGSTEYTPGVYTAPYFSIAETECHPGLYCYPARQMISREYKGSEIIEVRFRAADCHHAGSKWRVRTFEVIG